MVESAELSKYLETGEEKDILLLEFVHNDKKFSAVLDRTRTKTLDGSGYYVGIIVKLGEDVFATLEGEIYVDAQSGCYEFFSNALINNSRHSKTLDHIPSLVEQTIRQLLLHDVFVRWTSSIRVRDRKIVTLSDGAIKMYERLSEDSELLVSKKYYLPHSKWFLKVFNFIENTPFLFTVEKRKKDA